MVHIEFFESVEEMFEAERKAQDAANARVKEWQKQIKPGDCFRQETAYGFDIYGEVLESYTRAEMRHYRFCYCFSEACPEGERGDVHVSVITEVISRKDFEAIKAKLQGVS
jgi:hypothetical protein